MSNQVYRGRAWVFGDNIDTDVITPADTTSFGLDDEEELTLKEIGDKYNLSRERIRQLQELALQKIRKQIRE